MTLVLLLILQGRTSGGHGLLEALPRIYQVTPDIPDRRRATKQRKSGPSPADSLNESQLAARSAPFSSASDDTDRRIETASLEAIARLASVGASALSLITQRAPPPAPATRRSVVGERQRSPAADSIGDDGEPVLV